MRSKWKINFLGKFLIRKLINKNYIFNKIYLRHIKIPKFLTDTKIVIYNGTWFLKCIVTDKKIGYKFGEFSLTKRMGSIIHTQNK